MRMRYISQIQANIAHYQTIHSRRKSALLLDGSYKSVFKGKSMNFDELREYVTGDDVKDIDWKASSRSQKLLVRQYIAEKKHNILFIMDANKRMLADSEGLEEKRNLAILGAGTIAYFSEKAGDYVSAVYESEKGMRYFPFRQGLGNIEIILEKYHNAVTMNNTSDLNQPIEYILKNFKKRMIVFVVTDAMGINNISEKNLKRLSAAFDVLFINISDAAIENQKVYQMQDENYLPPFFTKDKKLQKRTRECRLKTKEQAEEKLEKYGIACSTIDYVKELEREIYNLLQKHGKM